MAVKERSRVEQQQIAVLKNLGLSDAQAASAVNQLLTNPVLEIQRTDRNIKYFVVDEGLQNRLLWSEQFEQSAWVKAGVTVTPDEVLGPFSQATGDRLEYANNFSGNYVRQNINEGSADGGTYSIYMKEGSGPTIANRIFIERWLAEQTLADVEINFATGDVIVWAGSPEVTVEAVGDGWWRVSLTFGPGLMSNGEELAIWALKGVDAGQQGLYSYRFGAQWTPFNYVSPYAKTTDTNQVVNQYYVPLPELIAGVNIFGVRVPGPLTVWLPLEAAEEQVIAVSDERGTADVDPITVRVA